MKKFEIFISYSHQDEWLKDELLEHLSALKRNGSVDVWHDRMILAGEKLSEEIVNEIESSDIFLFLVSPSFISSDFCMEKEYARAKERHSSGEAVIIPVIIRDCDWDVADLRSFNAVPPDGVAVTANAGSKSDTQLRDAKWLSVIKGLKGQIEALKKKLTPPELRAEYVESLYKVNFIRHPQIAVFDESLIYIDPELYSEKDKAQINTTSALVKSVSESAATIISGSDRSGKSLISKILQMELCKNNEPTIRVSGGQIGNADVLRIVRRQVTEQFETNDFPDSKFTIIIDDFDDCELPDRVKETIIRTLSSSYRRCVICSFTSAPSVLFAPDDLPNPLILSIQPLNNEKILKVVRKWKMLSISDITVVPDNEILSTFEHLMIIFEQTEAERYPYNVVTFLELIESALGSDIALSSFAACYETLIQQRLVKANSDWKQLDEFKNFLSLVAYRAFKENESGTISKGNFEECLDIFESQYLSSRKSLKEISVGLFLCENSTTFSFFEDYLWYFLCARYVAKRLSVDDRDKYNSFIIQCSDNIFQKKYANIVIYIAYFTEDNVVIKQLMVTLDRLFSKADDWILSDKSKSIFLGLATSDNLSISAPANVDEHRSKLLEEKVVGILDNAEEVVARYTLPFLDSKIEDSEAIEGLDRNSIDGDSYIKSVNALLRIHSVIGQILTGRSGTYGKDLVLTCITKMVQASGRYAYLNHAIAALLIYDKEKAFEEVENAIRSETLTTEQKYRKVMRIFAFWSVFLSQNGLARYLSQDHSIRALEILSEQFESKAPEDGHIPYNFTSVLLIAKLYNTGKIDKTSIESAIKKYGENSSIIAILRTTMHIYSYYMPLSIQDKQWISENLGLSLSRLELQQNRGKIHASKTNIIKHALEYEDKNESKL